MPKIFSGIRPSGRLHLGNYLGAVRNWVALQDEPDTTQAVYSVVDLHGITTPFDPLTYPQHIKDVILDYLAAGIDPSKSLLMRQSRVPQHTELMWLFSTITPVGWLERLPNWREKVQEVKEMGDLGASYRNNLGLLSYPVLMAADILIYKSDMVPVGADQTAHVELANELGAKFNHLFGDTFPKVTPLVTTGARIKSLLDPKGKMSKSGDIGIGLSDQADVVRDKLKRAVTDSGSEIKFDEQEKPAISNLLTIYQLLSGKNIGELEQDYDGENYAKFKSDLAEVIIGFLEPLQQRRAHYETSPDEVERILTESEEKAKIIANETLTQVRERMGLK